MELTENVFFPTGFARALAKGVHLYPDENLWDIEDDRLKQQAEDEIRRLREFQQLAMFASYEDSIYAYVDKDDLLEDQEKVLKIIHKTTSLWAKGHIADTLLAKITITQDSKIMTQAATLLLENLGVSKGEGGNGGGMKQLNVFLTKAQETEKEET